MIGDGIEFVGVSKMYGGATALDQVSMLFAAGHNTAILGPSGCGKSTLLRLLAGLETPTKGSIRIDGQTISAADRILRPPYQRGVAMVFQDLALWPNLSARENIRLGLAQLRLGRKDANRRVDESLALCGIQDCADRFPSQLSGGQQQRVALGRAIAIRPRFLLLDEPFSGVDLCEKMRLVSEIGRQARESHFQILLVSHDPWEAIVMCETAIILEKGIVAATAAVSDLVISGEREPFRSFRSLQDRSLSLSSRILGPKIQSNDPSNGR